MNTTTATETATETFNIGQDYSCTSAGDSTCVWTFTVKARTAKRMTIDDGYGAKVVGIKIDESGNEWALPLGRFSMAPVIRSDRTIY
jgi:hypothetical protein